MRVAQSRRPKGKAPVPPVLQVTRQRSREREMRTGRQGRGEGGKSKAKGLASEGGRG